MTSIDNWPQAFTIVGSLFAIAFGVAAYFWGLSKL